MWQRAHMLGGWTPYGVGIETEDKKEKKKKVEKQRCTKIKSDGTGCKIMVTKPKTRCHYHD